MPTVDVEGVHGSRPFDQMVLGKVENSSGDWGVLKQARLFNHYGVQATFFVDVYEYSLWGEPPIEKVCTDLLDLGQDVQLHTHPAWRDDRRDSRELRDLKARRRFYPQQQDFMAKLEYSDQVEVLDRGIELLYKWTGTRPVAHRSGGYSINSDTIRALAAVGIRADSSMNCSHPNSEILWSRNQIIDKNGILEFPVTVFHQAVQFPLCSISRRLTSRLTKTDLDVCTLTELERYAQAALDSGISLLNLFMHSYSLLTFDRRFRKIEADPDDFCKLDTLLRTMLANPRVVFRSCAQAVREFPMDEQLYSGSDHVPYIYSSRRFMKRAMQKSINILRDRMEGFGAVVQP